MFEPKKVRDVSYLERPERKLKASEVKPVEGPPFFTCSEQFSFGLITWFEWKLIMVSLESDEDIIEQKNEYELLLESLKDVRVGKHEALFRKRKLEGSTFLLRLFIPMIPKIPISVGNMGSRGYRIAAQRDIALSPFIGFNI